MYTDGRLAQSRGHSGAYSRARRGPVENFVPAQMDS